MALMIPKTLPDTANDAERYVFNALRQHLPVDCVVWYELPLVRQGRSVLPDFVVVGPHLGLVVIEVKGWTIDQIAQADKRRFTLLRRRQSEEKPNPLFQARQDVHTAIDLLKQSGDALLIHQEGDLAGKLRFPYAAIVALPHIRRSEFEHKSLDQILGPHDVLLREDLATDLEQRVREQRLFPGEMTPAMIEAVRRILYPEVLIPQPQVPAHQLPLLDFVQEQIIKSDLQLTAEGSDLARDLDARLVRGVVGSGKTLILLYRAMFLSQLNPDWRVLILTYNRMLAEYLRGRLSEIGGNLQQIEIASFHQWCSNALSPHGWLGVILDEGSQLGLLTRILAETPLAQALGTSFLVDEINWMKDHRLLTWNAYRQADRRGRGTGLDERQRQLVFAVFEAYQQQMAQHRQLDWGDVPIRVLEAIDAGVVAPAQYHAVLIDEAQDFAPTWFQVALRLLKPETNILFIVADGAQKIYRRAFSWASLGINIRGSRSRRLTRSYRNTYEILTAAYEMIRHDEGTRHELEAAGEEIIEPELTQGRMPHGPLPILLQFADPTTEYNYLAGEIRQLLDSGYGPAEILVASRRRGMLPHLMQALHERGIPVQPLLKQSLSLAEPTVKVSTLHSTKGLEFPVVFICGLEAEEAANTEPDPGTAESEERRLLYVGMTRARERVYISYHGQVPAWVLAALQSEPTEEDETVAFFQAEDLPPAEVFAFGEYHPYWSDPQRRIKNPHFDAWSGRILDLKEHDPQAADYFFQHLDSWLGKGFAIAAVPSHDPTNSASGIRVLAQRLAASGRIDATACLVRHRKIAQAARGGPRSIQLHHRTIRVEHPELVQGRPVLLLDDVTTSGSSLLACKQLLLEAGAAEVQCVALGQTVRAAADPGAPGLHTQQPAGG